VFQPIAGAPLDRFRKVEKISWRMAGESGQAHPFTGFGGLQEYCVHIDRVLKRHLELERFVMMASPMPGNWVHCFDPRLSIKI